MFDKFVASSQTTLQGGDSNWGFLVGLLTINKRFSKYVFAMSSTCRRSHLHIAKHALLSTCGLKALSWTRTHLTDFDSRLWSPMNGENKPETRAAFHLDSYCFTLVDGPDSRLKWCIIELLKNQPFHSSLRSSESCLLVNRPLLNFLYFISISINKHQTTESASWRAIVYFTARMTLNRIL